MKRCKCIKGSNSYKFELNREYSYSIESVCATFSYLNKFTMEIIESEPSSTSLFIFYDKNKHDKVIDVISYKYFQQLFIEL